MVMRVGQKIYTPDNIRQSEVLKDDRPYAGVLFASFGLSLRSPRQQRLAELILGLVGPSAQAEYSQSQIHQWISGIDPKGWGNQLGNELLLNVAYEHKWKLRVLGGEKGIGVELIPHYSAGAGNLSVFAGAGVQVRAAWNLPGDFGAQLVLPGGFRSSSPGGGRGPGLCVFAAIDRKAVGRNLLLDGNTFRESHSVERNPFTSDLLLGSVLAMGRLRIEYEQVFWTKKFPTESRRQSFSSLGLRYSL